MSKGMCNVHCIGSGLLIVGGLNWGLVGLFNWNLVEALFGAWPLVVKVVYILVGVAAIAALLTKQCGQCKK